MEILKLTDRSCECRRAALRSFNIQEEELKPMSTNDDGFNQRGRNSLPGYLGIVFTQVQAHEVRAHLPVRGELMAPNGFLHAATVVALADTACGYGCVANLPSGASGFTTIELKSNHLGTARDGTIECTATPVHLGKTTQVWDATVKHRESGKTLALFRCTQMVLMPK
ncbi:MAG TPA: PaaI family thioesterase [Fontimonas sp.]